MPAFVDEHWIRFTAWCAKIGVEPMPWHAFHEKQEFKLRVWRVQGRPALAR